MRYVIPAILFVLAACTTENGARDTATAAPDPTTDAAPINATMDQVSMERLHRGEQSGYSDSARIAIRTQAELDEAWRRAHGEATPAPTTPTVDFGNSMVVIAAMGERATGGFEIAVDSVQRSADGIVVHVTSARPAESCMVPMVITHPIDVVRVDDSAQRVEFRERQAVREC